MDAEVDEALRLGSFPDALRLAIRRSGLSLDRLESRLQAQNINIRRSTLSYWQQGRRRPEAVSSIKALTALEEILGIPEGTFIDMLGPRKPRGRWINHRVGALGWAEMWPLSDDLKRMVTADNRRNNDRLQDISLTESFEIGADRRMQWLRIQTVTEALETGADRMMLVYNSDPDLDVSRITLTNLEDCRIGRHRADVAANFVAFELLFDRALTQGETYVYGFRVNFTDAFLSSEELGRAGLTPYEATVGVRAFRTSSNAYVMKARFDPESMPVQCYHVQSSRMTANRQDVRQIGLSREGSAHVALKDVRPGVHGIRWEWE